MKLQEYINNLQKVLDEHGDLDVVYAVDDEGNGFGEVHFTPTVGHYSDREFYSNEEDFEDYGIDKNDKNAVCVN